MKSLIYPVPDPRFPFLGVHFTQRIHGGVDAGPNAVLAFKREGYRKTDFSFQDMAGTLGYPGFWRMAGKYWRSGAAEVYRSLSKKAFVRALQRLVPEVGGADLVADGSGVRAQAVRPDGFLVDDFQFLRNGEPSARLQRALAGGNRFAGDRPIHRGNGRKGIWACCQDSWPLPGLHRLTPPAIRLLNRQ